MSFTSFIVEEISLLLDSFAFYIFLLVIAFLLLTDKIVDRTKSMAKDKNQTQMEDKEKEAVKMLYSLPYALSFQQEKQNLKDDPELLKNTVEILEWRRTPDSLHLRRRLTVHSQARGLTEKHCAQQKRANAKKIVPSGNEDSDEAQNSNVHVSTPVTNSSDKIVDRTKSMAKDKNQTQMDGECLYSPTCGRNICIDGSTATWINNDSGGRFFIDRSLSPDEEIVLTFSGKGHAEVGIISIDPITITDVIYMGIIKELTVIQTARIYKQEGTTKIKRSTEGDKIITEAEGNKSRSKVDKEQSVWITVNILFGDLKVKIGSKGFKFSPNKGENVSTTDGCANLSKPYPCAVCYVLNPIQRGKTLAFQVEDINKGGTSSKKCSFKLAISKSNPEEFMLSADKYSDITSLSVIHFEEIPTKYNKEISVELTTDGTVKIKHEKGTITKDADIEQVYCVFELGRIQLRCARKERQNNENTVPPISRIIDTHTNQSDVPDSVYTNHQNVKSQPEKYKSLIHKRIPEDFQMFVSMLGIKPVLDYLYQDGNITMEDFQRLRQLAKWDMAEANRELLFIILRKQNLDTEFLEDISTKSKQDGILAKMFPHQSNRKQHVTQRFMDGPSDKEIHRLKNSKIDKYKGLKNLLIRCNGYFVNCDVDRRLHTKMISSVPDIPSDVKLSGNQISDFSKLLFTSHHLERKTLPSTFWINMFLPVVENKDSNLCLLLLTIMTEMTTEQWENCHHYLLKGLSVSMTNQDKDTSKVIAWFVTKKLFLSLDKSIRETITDIWPAFSCNCHRSREQQIFCSDKIQINIEIKTLRSDLPDTFWKIDIHYIIEQNVGNEERSEIHKHVQNSSGKIHSPNKTSISGVDAKHLFIEHTNLTLICKSSFKSTGFLNEKPKVIEQSCFQLYCKRKGFIPIGENHFPSTLNGLQTDVLEGTPHFLSNLKVGNQVGTDEYKRGTLGGFVQVRGDKAFLTCLHVFLSADELASDNLSLDDEKTVSVKLYSKNKIPRICGKIREIAFEVDNEKETSIDAALVEIQTDSIKSTDYVDIEGRQLSFRDIAMKSEYLNDSCVDYRPLCFSTPKPILHTFCVGAISGCQDSGASSASRTQVHENKDKNIDFESIEDTYSKAILDEIKTNVKIVIQSLRLIPEVVPPDEHAIIMKIEQNCDPNISAEIKSIVIDVLKNIYPTLQCAGGVDIDRFIHQVIFCNTQSRFSAILGDVHMQQAFLKKTGQNMAVKRTSRRVYNQLYISNIPFQPGDSGTCIYVKSPVQGCIGMAIADHPQGGCIATPIMDILKHFKIRIK